MVRYSRAAFPEWRGFLFSNSVAMRFAIKFAIKPSFTGKSLPLFAFTFHEKRIVKTAKPLDFIG